MKSTCYLILSAQGVERMTKQPPALHAGEIDLAELRRLAEAATDYPAARGLDGWGWDMARTTDNPLGDQVRLYFDPPQVRYVAAVPPDVVLALLDRIDTLEAVVTGDGSGHHLPPFDPRALRTDQVHVAAPVAPAGEQPGSAPADEPRWCAKHRDGWCAVVPDVEPEEGTDGVGTLCGYVITFPGGFDHRVPDCAECLAAGSAPADTQEAHDA